MILDVGGGRLEPFDVDARRPGGVLVRVAHALLMTRPGSVRLHHVLLDVQSLREILDHKIFLAGLLHGLILDVFPGADIQTLSLEALTEEIRRQCKLLHLDAGDIWLNKILQLYSIQEIQHGVMLVGPSGSGKTTAWKVLLKSMQKIDGVEGISYVMDPKAITKEELHNQSGSQMAEGKKLKKASTIF